jgi:light-regulated signal transduction histidine kinase (bacteriophytochrome)
LPLTIGEQVVGVLSAASRQPSAFSDEDQAMLMTTADQLSIAIQNASLYEQVQRHAAELEQRVLERTAQLEAANRELEAFSYSVSHDLRSPLRAIDGFSRILLRDYAALLPAEGQHRLQLVRSNAQQMGHLIDDLLTFSRMSRQPLNKQPVVVSDFVRRVIDELRGEQEDRPIEIIIGDLPPCLADPALLKHVFVNLLSNALKFSGKRDVPRIEVGHRSINHEQVYYIKDNGVGFDMRYVDKLFGVFQRLHSSEEFAGTGVGLAIVQRIIHRHGGRIWAEAAVGAGATFFFTLRGETHGD